MERLYLHGAAPVPLVDLPVPARWRPLLVRALAYDEDTTLTERVLPDGAARLIFELDGVPRARLVGPSTQFVRLALAGRRTGLSLTLAPGATLALFGIPAHALAERAVAWDELGDPELPARLAETRGDPLRLLLGALRPRDVPDAARIARALALRGSVASIADALGLGERRLQQLFRSHVGMSPRAWGRLQRLHACLRMIGRARSLGELALDAGFYDQAHLTNEVRALCGVTPDRLRAIAGSSKTAT